MSLTPLQDREEAEERLAREHDFTRLGWCRRCGSARADVMRALSPCADGVVGISHLRRPMGLRLMLRDIRKRWREAAHGGGD